MDEFLKSTDIIDWVDSAVLAQAAALREGVTDPIAVAKRCFEFVRDDIRHSHDFGLLPVTCSASDVLRERSGYCYGKSHLLAALLRANNLPTGLCYQRLSQNDNGAPYSLHGLNAVFLPGVGWYRIDARGNRAGVDAQFTPPIERLAFPVRLAGEADWPDILPDPLPVVVDALRSHSTADELWEHLPDLPISTTPASQRLQPSAADAIMSRRG